MRRLVLVGAMTEFGPAEALRGAHFRRQTTAKSRGGVKEHPPSAAAPTVQYGAITFVLQRCVVIAGAGLVVSRLGGGAGSRIGR